MKVLNLQCELGHGFEGWFGSEADYEQQTTKLLLRCPLCDSATIHKLPSAPRLHLSGTNSVKNSADHSTSKTDTPPDAPQQAVMSMPQEQQLQRMMMQAARELMSQTKDVGERFAEQARRMHYGELAPEAIRGRASREDAQALHEEGIEFMALPMPELLKEPLQ
jgi:hypothetical protein